jgi:uroporphyrin-III C-methyltransferase
VAASFAVIAGHREQFMRTDWSQYTQIDTLIVLMGVENREYIAESLMREGRKASEPVAFVENSGTPRQRVVEATLGEVARGCVDASAPAVFVIGEVVRLRSKLAAGRLAEVRA